MNCKPGELAYIVESQFPENVGHVVEIVSAYGDFRDEGFCWNVMAITPMKGEGEIDGRLMYQRDGFIPDSCLRPISGVPVEDDVDLQATLPAPRFDAMAVALGISREQLEREWGSVGYGRPAL